MTPHTFKQISQHVRWLSPYSPTDRPTLGAISGSWRTLLVDAGASPAHASRLLQELAGAGVTPPHLVALTHWHWDHIFGSATLALPALAYVETQRVMGELARLDWGDEALDRRVERGEELAFCRDMIKAELPDRSMLTIRAPEIGFDDRLEVDLGGLSCSVVHVGGDHAADSSIVYVPADKILFLGDCLYPAIYAPERHYTTGKLFPLLDRLLSYDVDYYLAGHDPEPIPRQQLEREAEEFRLVGAIVERRAGERAAILSDLGEALGFTPGEDQLWMVDAFIAGLGSKPLS